MMTKILCAVSILALTGCAGLVPLARDDVQAALAIAQAAKDPAGIACAQAIMASLGDPAAPKPPQPAGAFSAFMAARELRRSVDAGPDEAVRNACAPLVLDTMQTLSRLGLMATPGGGVLGGFLK